MADTKYFEVYENPKTGQLYLSMTDTFSQKLEFADEWESENILAIAECIRNGIGFSRLLDPDNDGPSEAYWDDLLTNADATSSYLCGCYNF
ncbi:hypothetical protein HCH52_12080 [Oscillospiraceae bacterium HV4-5-C5C]|nr:hypothetical protein [Oscillospiraceae bacterium HV4-5-C5C]